MFLDIWTAEHVATVELGIDFYHPNPHFMLNGIEYILVGLAVFTFPAYQR